MWVSVKGFFMAKKKTTEMEFSVLWTSLHWDMIHGITPTYNQKG